jgi:hypothetical protein
VALEPIVGPWSLFQFLDLLRSLSDFSDGGSVRNMAATCTHRTARTQNKRIQSSMPEVGFEPTISMFEQVKTVHALDRAAAVIGNFLIASLNKLNKYMWDVSEEWCVS